MTWLLKPSSVCCKRAISWFVQSSLLPPMQARLITGGSLLTFSILFPLRCFGGWVEAGPCPGTPCPLPCFQVRAQGEGWDRALVELVASWWGVIPEVYYSGCFCSATAEATNEVVASTHVGAAPPYAHSLDTSLVLDYWSTIDAGEDIENDAWLCCSDHIQSEHSCFPQWLLNNS